MTQVFIYAFDPSLEKIFHSILHIKIFLNPLKVTSAKKR